MKDERLYVIHILECITRIEECTRSGRVAFMSSFVLQDAVLRNLQTMCESTQCFSDLTKARHPEIDWHALAGLRNILVHDYLKVDLGTVWDIMCNDLPTLKATAESMLSRP